MIKKTITYTGFDGKEYTEDFYFNMNEAELARAESSIPGGFSGKIQRVIDSPNPAELIEIFEYFIQKSYGVKTPDGKGFMKKPEYLDSFMATEAYSQLFMELATDSDKAVEFVNGIMPANIAKRANSKILEGVIQ